MTDPLVPLILAACCRIAVRAADAALQVWTIRVRARLEAAASPSATTAGSEPISGSQR
jgi:hypothetical protein